MKLLRDEYPRPQFRRDDWLMLNGEWEFDFDDDETGIFRKLHEGKTSLSRKINVPFCYQYKASGIGDESVHEVVWYRRTFTVKKSVANKRALLCFNGSDRITDVWINGQFAVTHTGGYAPFYADITQYLCGEQNTIVVRCTDRNEPTAPRGKQSWTDKPFACWYVASTGIWQSVWIEFIGDDGLDGFTVTPDIDTLSFAGEITTVYGKADALEIKVAFGGREIKRQTVSLDGKHTRYSVALMECDFVDETTYWTVENPNLYGIELTLYSAGKIVDIVHTRFGMRKVGIDESGNITLNNRKLYQRLILDQGYWKESGITPPSAQSLRDDIAASKAMGFNGARKHQKIEDPYFYYYADEMGFLTWCEMPSAYNFCAEEIASVSAEWQAAVKVARAFSSIICYVPLNESWGVRKILTEKTQQDFGAALYYITKALDPSRLVSTNDGWENIQTTDIISIHDYAYDSRAFVEKYRYENLDGLYPQGRKLMAIGHCNNNKPMLFSEFGGIAMQVNAVDGNWGYGKGAANLEDLYARLENLVKGVRACPFQGYCYTQLTDVQQEVNGLLDADHKPKADIKRLREIFEM